MNTPILFLIFNRPDLTEEVFATIKQAKPKQLFIAADGPREHKEGEALLCEQTRDAVLNKIDWDCDVHTLLREENLGCKIAVSQAITWFFEHVEEGIILEDDILPNKTFFPFCEELLDKYRYDERVMTISGINFLESWKVNTHSYFYSHLSIWGWASWRRAWQFYDRAMTNWIEPDVQTFLKTPLSSIRWFDYYKGMFDAAYKNSLDTWDVQWFYSILMNNGLAVNPSVNLIKNIGFRADASHTHDITSPAAKLETSDILFPLKHPNYMILDTIYLDEVANKLIRSTNSNDNKIKVIFKKIKSILKSILIK